MPRNPLRSAYWRLLEASPPGLAVRLSYLRAQGRLPDLSRPRRLSELIMAYKLGGDDGRWADLTDKVKVKAHVARVAGPSLVTPTLWHGPALPPRPARDWPVPFVLKANHGSGMNAFVRDARDLDWDALEARAERWLRTDWPRWLCEGWYNRIDRQLLVEPLLGADGQPPADHKVLVFSGRAEFVQVEAGRFGAAPTRTYYDRDWAKQPFEVVRPRSPGHDPRPAHLPAMLAAAEALGDGFAFVRVDFYDLPDGPRFGEMTFAPGAGLDPITPDRFDLALGRLWLERAAERAGRTGRPGA